MSSISPPPYIDPLAHYAGTPAFQEAERLAIKHGLTYLSFTGIFKLAAVIEEARGLNSTGKLPPEVKCRIKCDQCADAQGYPWACASTATQS